MYRVIIKYVHCLESIPYCLLPFILFRAVEDHHQGVGLLLRRLILSSSLLYLRTLDGTSSSSKGHFLVLSTSESRLTLIWQLLPTCGDLLTRMPMAFQVRYLYSLPYPVTLIRRLNIYTLPKGDLWTRKEGVSRYHNYPATNYLRFSSFGLGTGNQILLQALSNLFLNAVVLGASRTGIPFVNNRIAEPQCRLYLCR